jgi:signal transduction histidine kinase
MELEAAAEQSTAEFLSGGGETGARLRALDWSRAPLGDPRRWPRSLKTIVRMMLDSRYAMWMAWGPELTFFCNDAYLPTVGIRRDWVLGARSDDVWREIWPDIGPRIERVLTGGEATWDEGLLLFLERSGFAEETYHTFSYSPVYDDRSRIAGMLCVVTEVTERVIGERRLRVLRDLAGATSGSGAAGETCRRAVEVLARYPFDIPFCAFYLIDAKRGTARLAAATRAFPPEQMAAEIFLPGYGGPWPIGEVLRTRSTARVHDLPALGLEMDSGSWPDPVKEALAVPLIDAGQDAVGGFALIGLSPRRPPDGAYVDFIELAVGQLAAAIGDARAYEAERARAQALAEIDRAKTAFFSNASHEFRTPLTLIIGPLEELLRRSVTSEQVLAARDEIQLVYRNSLRLMRLVNTLLDFSRIEAGRVQAIYEPVDLAACTAELASTFRSTIERGGLRLVVDCPPLGTQAWVDLDMWEKIVLNLLSNAFKYTLDGEVGVALKRAPRGETAQLVVSDTGVGIPRHELPRLFERFHRIEGQRGRTHEGTGIGLALVQELARLHGGTAAVDSALGRGTVITITIPLGKDHLPADRIGAPRPTIRSGVPAQAFVEEALRWLPGDRVGTAAAAGALAAADREVPAAQGSSPARVLVVDDNADMCEYLSHLLAERYQVEAARDGQEGLEAARRARPDLVLTDVMMPRLDGFGLLRALRGDPSMRDVPIVVLSARAGEDAKVEGLEAGADDYLVKPFSARELLARVSANIETARIRREAAEHLRRLNETLERRVAAEVDERIKLEAALRQAQKMEAIGRLTGGIAHDFNNLLQVIYGSLEALRRRAMLASVKSADEDFQRLLASAIGGAERAATLTHRLLAFARQQPLAPQPVDVNKLVSGMSDLVRSTIGETIDSETVLAAGLWRVRVDPNQLESTLLNLIVNSRDAMPDGGKLTVETANSFIDETYAAANEELRPGQYVLISVTDTGSGMTREVIARAFEPFFTTKTAGRGTGLGLSQVYGFVKQSGGHVSIYSEPGRGTTVNVYLPRLQATAIESEQSAGEPPAPGARQGDVVLVVEDEEDVRAHSADMLRELGYRVLDAGDGHAALRIIEANPAVTLLFTDVGLPGGLNGRQLAAAAEQRRPGLKVLFTTGYARNAIVHNQELDPGIALLTKPFTYAALAAKVRGVIESG